MNPDRDQSSDPLGSQAVAVREDTSEHPGLIAETISPRALLERVAAGIGNRGFTRLLARMPDGDGILPSGLVHPDVQAAITASRGAGNPLTGGVSRHLEASLGERLGDVRVHTDDRAAALARAVSARAFTVGSDVFFGSGEYDPSSRGGTELIAHEVAHVVQQRGARAHGPLTVSHPRDPSELEAEAVAREVTP